MPPRRFKKKSVRKIVEKRVAKAIEKYEKTRADSNNILTNKTEAPQGATPGTKSIWNSTCRAGGSPCKSSGKTFENSRMIGTSSSRFSSDLSSFFLDVTYAR
ncbi:hypothetical protein Tco_0723456 [Tanacetum coccineum]